MKGWAVIVGILILGVIVSSGCTQPASSPSTLPTTSIQPSLLVTEQISQPTVEVRTTSPVNRNPVLLEDRAVVFGQGIGQTSVIGISMKIPKNWIIIQLGNGNIISSYPRDVAIRTKDDELLNGNVPYDSCYPRICEGYTCFSIYGPERKFSHEHSLIIDLTTLRYGLDFQKDSIAYNNVTIDKVEMKRITALLSNGDPFVEYTSATLPPWDWPISFASIPDYDMVRSEEESYFRGSPIQPKVRWANTTNDIETFDQIVQTVKFLPWKAAQKEYDNLDLSNVTVATPYYGCNFPMSNSSVGR
jgi:hypothetical protein